MTAGLGRLRPGDEASLAVVLGRCDDMRAEVFVRAALPGIDGRLTLAGTLAGPRCRRAITLPVTARLQDVAPSADAPPPADAGQREPRPALARAILTEPSFWTPELPNLYRLEAVLGCDGHEVARIDRLIGLRRLGVRGRSFWLDGRRWVPRCVAWAAEDPGVTTAAETGSTAWLVDPDESFLMTTDEAGVAVMAVVPPSMSVDLVAARVARWSLHPSVVGVVMPPETTADGAQAMAREARSLKGTLLFGWAVRGDLPPVAPPVDIDFLAVTIQVGGLPHETWRSSPPVPLVAVRQEDMQPRETLPQRLACDRLQADLAAWWLAGGPGPRDWDWAGYAVT